MFTTVVTWEFSDLVFISEFLHQLFLVLEHFFPNLHLATFSQYLRTLDFQDWFLPILAELGFLLFLSKLACNLSSSTFTAKYDIDWESIKNINGYLNELLSKYLSNNTYIRNFPSSRSIFRRPAITDTFLSPMSSEISFAGFLLEEVVKRIFLSVDLWAGLGDQRVLTLTPFSGMHILLPVPTAGDIFEEGALREQLILRPPGWYNMTEPS